LENAGQSGKHSASQNKQRSGVVDPTQTEVCDKKGTGVRHGLSDRRELNQMGAVIRRPSKRNGQKDKRGEQVKTEVTARGRFFRITLTTEMK